MKDAQDAVKEIREWPVQKYLLIHPDGELEFSDVKPPVIACTHQEFIEAMEADKLNNLSEIVKSCGGVWPSEDIPNGYLLDFLAPGTHTISSAPDEEFICSRAEFEAEARRQGYLSGLEGYSDDVASKGEWLPAEGTECEYRLCGGPWYPCKVLYVLRGNDDPDADGWRAVVWCPHLEKDQLAYLPRFEFRPLKSDRERWVEAARDKGFKAGPAGRMYDALLSGELPMPEKD